MLKEIVEELNESDSKEEKILKLLLKKKGYIEIVYGDRDTWATIDYIDDGIAYGMDQFDNDVEFEIGVDYFQIKD